MIQSAVGINSVIRQYEEELAQFFPGLPQHTHSCEQTTSMAMAVPANLTPEEYQFILNLPVMPPPPGIEAQLDQPPDYTGMIIVVVISVVLATVSVLISVYTKLVIMKKPSWADREFMPIDHCMLTISRIKFVLL